MTIQELKIVLDSTGIPFAYNYWEDAPKLPYGVFVALENSEFYADGEIYYSFGRYRIEVYTKRKAPPTEAKVEAALAQNQINYQKYENYITSEKLYQISYEIEV